MMMVEEALRRVLVVEDDERVRGALCDYLEELGYVPEPAANGVEAIERLDEHEFRLVVTDYKMPGLTGLEVAKQMRARDPSLPVVIVSGYTTEFAWEARALGIPIVAKPVDFGAFARIVEDFARR